MVVNRILESAWQSAKSMALASMRASSWVVAETLPKSLRGTAGRREEKRPERAINCGYRGTWRLSAPCPPVAAEAAPCVPACVMRRQTRRPRRPCSSYFRPQKLKNEPLSPRGTPRAALAPTPGAGRLSRVPGAGAGAGRLGRGQAGRARPRGRGVARAQKTSKKASNSMNFPLISVFTGFALNIDL